MTKRKTKKYRKTHRRNSSHNGYVRTYSRINQTARLTKLLRNLIMPHLQVKRGGTVQSATNTLPLPIITDADPATEAELKENADPTAELKEKEDANTLAKLKAEARNPNKQDIHKEIKTNWLNTMTSGVSSSNGLVTQTLNHLTEYIKFLPPPIPGIIETIKPKLTTALNAFFENAPPINELPQFIGETLGKQITEIVKGYIKLPLSPLTPSTYDNRQILSKLNNILENISHPSSHPSSH